MDNNEQSSEEYIEIADKIRSGEYFRDARLIFNFDVHDPMAERYWYLFLTLLSIIIMCIAFVAWRGLYPLEPRVPFVFGSDNIADDYPVVKSLADFRGEDPNAALRRFLVKQYVKVREEYSAATFDRNHNSVRSMSTQTVLDEYEQLVSPVNPSSPISLYQRHTQRNIKVILTKPVESDSAKNKQEYSMFVLYDAIEKKGDKPEPPVRYQVNIAFQYKDIKLDPVTEKIEPYGFIVTSYHTKIYRE